MNCWVRLCALSILRRLLHKILLPELIPFLAVLLLWACEDVSQAQGGKGAPQGQGGPASSLNSSSSGISVPRDDWSTILAMRPTGKGTTFLCYRLTTLDSATTPYRIVPYPSDTKGNAKPSLKDNQGKDVPCTYVNVKHPLLMDAKLVIAIDLRLFPGDQSFSSAQVDTQRIAELVYNIQVTAGTPLSPNPIRTASTGATINLGPKETPNVLFLAWPYELPGDSVPQLSVTLLYDPPKAGDPWSADVLYPPGSVVTANAVNAQNQGTYVAHFYGTDHGGQSGDVEPDWTMVSGPQPQENDCKWTWIGAAGTPLPQTSQIKQKTWSAGTTYQTGDIIQAPGSTQLFVMSKPPGQQCTAGTMWDPNWNVGHRASDNLHRPKVVKEPPVTPDGDPQNGGVLWIPGDPPNGGKCSNFSWKARTPYGDSSQNQPLYICVPPSRDQARQGIPDRWYVVAANGTSGTAIPSFIEAGISWSLVPNSALNCKVLGQPAPVGNWQATVLYKNGSTMCEPSLGIYTARISSADGSYSGTVDPIKKYPASLSWYDAGPTPPSTVTGLLATEQTLGSLPTITLPQSHSRFSYNVASGLLITTLRTKSFGYAAGSTITTNSGMVIQTGSTLLIDPVASLTKYFVAFDSEKKWSPRDLIPGLTVSFSLSSPTNNFYAGGSTEFARYLQFEYGYVAARLPQPTTGTFVASSSTTPPTKMVFNNGAYIGISFDISGLISGMGGGGSSKGGSSTGGGNN